MSRVSHHNRFFYTHKHTASSMSSQPHSERTYQHYKSRPFTRTGTILCHFFINQELCVIGVRGLRFSWRTLPIFSETETSAQASCGGRHANVRCADINKPLWHLHIEKNFSCKLNKEQTDKSTNCTFLPVQIKNLSQTSHDTDDTVRSQ